MKILYKDKADIDDLFKKTLPAGFYLGAMEKPTSKMLESEILSVKFSKVGETTIRNMPNLKYIINRAHGTDNINLNLCEKRGIKVLSASPTTFEVGSKIIKELDCCLPPYTIVGYGNIGQFVHKKIKARIITSSTKKEDIEKILKKTKTLIGTVSLNTTTKNYFNKDVFKHLKKADMIHVSRSETINNEDLLEAIKNENIIFAVIDTLGPIMREEIINTGKVAYTKHTFWKYNFDKKRYLKAIAETINSILK